METGKMDSFIRSLLNLSVSAENQFQRSKMVIHLEPDLYERFTFTLKQSLVKESHMRLDSGKLLLNTPVGKLLIVKDLMVDGEIEEVDNETK